MPSSIRSVACASSSSMRAKAKPTWISTQSPGLGPSSLSRAMLTRRLAPPTSTKAYCPSTLSSSVTSPGIPRHIMAHRNPTQSPHPGPKGPAS